MSLHACWCDNVWAIIATSTRKCFNYKKCDLPVTGSIITHPVHVTIGMVWPLATPTRSYFHCQLACGIHVTWSVNSLLGVQLASSEGNISGDSQIGPVE